MAVAAPDGGDSPTDAALISKLENSEFSNIYSLFSSHLRPFTDFANPKPVKKPSRSRTAANAAFENDVATIRALAKRFLTFLNKSLSMIPKRLLADPKPEVQAIEELLNAYELCLKCLEAVSLQLSCKPWFLYAQRARMIHCLERCGRYVAVEEEGFALLGKFEGLDGVVKWKGKGVTRRCVPELGSGGVDNELAMLVVDIVVAIVKCLCLRDCKEDESYRRVLQLVCESRMWFRALDANTYEKLHRALVIYLSNSSVYLMERVSEFNEDLVFSFFSITLVEYGRSPIKEQTSKFARRICSSVLSSQIERGSSMIVDILHCVLQSILPDLGVDGENSAAAFLEIVSCISSRCRNVCPVLRTSVAACLNDIADKNNQDYAVFSLILKIFSIGLPYNRDFLSSLKDQPKFVTLVQEDCNLKQLQAVLCSFRSLFHNINQQNCLMSAWLNHLNVPESMYYDMLSYICYPWAELVNSNKKHVLAEEESGIPSANLCVIQDACLMLCEAFIFLQRSTHMTEDKRCEPDDNPKSVLKVAVAALIISFRTMTKIEESTSVAEKIISDGSCRPTGLKYLFVSFYNIGVIMYRSNQLPLASKALYLCCRSAWSCVSLLCHMFIRNSHSFSNDLSETEVLNFVTDACVKSAFFLDVAHQCSSHDLDKELTYCLENWSVAWASFSCVSVPIALVKEWVKIECKLHKEISTSEQVPTLSCLLSSSSVQKKTIAILLEQELLEYEEISARSPTFSHLMQKKIINILLNDMYTTHASGHQRSNIMMKKGKLLRICDNGTIEESIQCISEAIDAKNHSQDNRSKWTVRDKHQLAVAYCLRAFSIHEVDPSSEKVLQDVEAAMQLWLSLCEDSGNDGSSLDVSQTAIPLLCHVLDLLSLKVHTSFHSNLYKLLLKFFKWRNIPATTYLPMLWESRRLSHALCPLPINQDFIAGFAEDVGGKCKSMEYWISCLKESHTLLLSFEQKLSYVPALLRASCCSGSSFGRPCTVDEVKEAAKYLISNVFRNKSLFLAAHLYHDLSERLVYCGKLIEGLSYAKEAHRLRSKLLQERFIYTIKQQNEADHGVVDVERQDYSLKNFSIMKSVAGELWSLDKLPFDLERYLLSPWSVLQCYVESTLQVGVIHEMLGNSIDAEILLKWGRNICSSQGLTFLMVAFSCVLGKLYRKRKLWDLAANTLEKGKKVFSDCMIHVTCLKCKLIYEINLDLQLGDLFRSHINCSAGYTSSDQVFLAEKQYKAGLHKLKLPEWRNSVSCPRKLSEGRTKTSNCKPKELEYNVFPVSLEKAPANLEAKRVKKTKETPRNLHPPNNSIAKKNVRVTRSRARSSQISVPSEPDDDLNANPSCSNVNEEYTSFDTLSQELSFLNIRDPTIQSSCALCLRQRMKCWQCLPIEVHESGLVDNFVFLKWELLRRRLSLKLLMKIGKCLLSRGQSHGAHEVYSESLAVLRIGNHLQYTFSATHDAWFEPRDEEICEDALAVERALVIYNVCLHSVMTYHTKNTRDVCCDAFRIEFPRILSWLKLAFVLCREVPNLFQKISRLLASLYVVSSTNDVFSSPPSSLKALSDSHWAAYFHQASIGSHFNYQILSSLAGKSFSENPSDKKVAKETSAGAEKWDILRLSPEQTQSLDDFVLSFYQALPSAAVLCLSLLGGTLGSVLHKLLGHPSTVIAWTLLSRFNSVNQPVVILGPLDSVLDDDDSTNSVIRNLFGGDDDKDWHCPWGSSVVDSVAPIFRGLLKENYLSSSTFPLEDTKENRSLWWTRRKKLDQSLDTMLRDLEHSWFGAWKYLFLGGWSDCKYLDSAIKKLTRVLKSKFKVDINPNLLKIYLGGARYAIEMGESFSNLSLKSGCFTEQAKNSRDDKNEALLSALDFVENLPTAVIELILETANELENQPSLRREPIILVLDLDVQMLPLENMPILRNEEVYRMPSVGSITVTLDRSRIRQEEIKGFSPFPLIDPLDAFYLLNPSGDLSSTQQEFEKWFNDQNLEGKAGDAPSVDELFSALKKHDLFIYFGHGSGSQYIPGHEIQKLESCAATLLMGCSSGTLHLSGSYLPRGMPLSYLMAGSPAIIANLWEVTDKDIDRFGKAILDAWLIERSNSHSDSEGRPKIGSFISKAREACTLPYLIGAAPVCYGVPTGIWKKRDT